MGPKDPILSVADNYAACEDPFKIDLVVPAYRCGLDGRPEVPYSVQLAQEYIVERRLDHEYCPITGIASFIKHSINLAYGATDDVVQSDRVAALQSLSGTGALQLSSQYFAKWLGKDLSPTVFLPNPTCPHHFSIYEDAGLKTQTYRYWNPNTKGLDFEGLLADLDAPQSPSIVLLHACAHNPTGVDPTNSQWKEISKLCKDKGHFVIFDSQSQGFASGDTEKDIAAVRYFVKDGHNIALCQSFSQNFGLYGQRIGCFSIVCDSAEEKARVESQLKIIAGTMYPSPPLHGARIVDTILDSNHLREMWQNEIKEMSRRIINIRKLLKKRLAEAGSTLNWDHITDQIGMWCYTGMTPEQSEILADKYNIFLTHDGRISMAGVNRYNVDKLAEAMHSVTK